MAIALRDKLDRSQVEARAAVLIAEELTLRDLGRAGEQMQADRAEAGMRMVGAATPPTSLRPGWGS